jgi:hypothetical protein
MKVLILVPLLFVLIGCDGTTTTTNVKDLPGDLAILNMSQVCDVPLKVELQLGAFRFSDRLIVTCEQMSKKLEGKTN